MYLRFKNNKFSDNGWVKIIMLLVDVIFCCLCFILVTYEKKKEISNLLLLDLTNKYIFKYSSKIFVIVERKKTN